MNGFMSMDLKLSVDLGITVTEYKQVTPRGSAQKLSGIFMFGLEATYNGMFGTFRAWVAVKWDNSVTFMAPEQPRSPRAWIAFDVQGSIKLGAEAGYTADLYFWSASHPLTVKVFGKPSGQVTYQPECLRWPKGEPPVLGKVEFPS